jgi:hypothetical protein
VTYLVTVNFDQLCYIAKLFKNIFKIYLLYF